MYAIDIQYGAAKCCRPTKVLRTPPGAIGRYPKDHSMPRLNLLLREWFIYGLLDDC